MKQTHEVSEIDDKVDILYSENVACLARISSKSLQENQAQELFNLLSAFNDLESIGDIIEAGTVDLVEQ